MENNKHFILFKNNEVNRVKKRFEETKQSIKKDISGQTETKINEIENLIKKETYTDLKEANYLLNATYKWKTVSGTVFSSTLYSFDEELNKTQKKEQQEQQQEQQQNIKAFFFGVIICALLGGMILLYMENHWFLGLLSNVVVGFCMILLGLRIYFPASRPYKEELYVVSKIIFSIIVGLGVALTIWAIFAMGHTFCGILTVIAALILVFALVFESKQQ